MCLLSICFCNLNACRGKYISVKIKKKNNYIGFVMKKYTFAMSDK